MLELVRCTGKNADNAPRAREGVLQFVYLSFGSVRFDSTSRKDNIADGVDAWVRTARVDELAMLRTLFASKKIGDLATCREAGGEFLGVRDDRAR